MAGWSMATEEEDAVDFSKTPKSFDLNKSPESVSYSDSAVEKSINELVSLFRSLLESFLVEFCPPPLPPVTSDGRSIDLFSLFINVSHRGGFKAVSGDAAWDEVGQESGLGFGNTVSPKLIYVKYLAALARWLNRVVGGDSSVKLPGISEDLIGRLRDFVSQVKREYELSKGMASREVGAEFKWFISKTKRRFDVDKCRIGSNESVKTSDKKLEKVMMLDYGSNKDCSSPGKRKRECSLETLRWLSEVAKDPCDISVGSLPDRSKWEYYGSEEPWKQLLLFRASRTNTDPSCQKIWQKMHPSLYQDSVGPTYNLRERLALDDERNAGKGKMSSEDDSGSDEEDESWALIGSEFQADVPEWTGITSESDSKWLGTLIWPLKKEQNNNNLLIERDPIGKGRQDACGCQNPGSVECVRFHVKAKQEKLKLELGSAFYMWCFDTMGEGNLQYWTDLELKKVVSLMPSPPSLIPSFIDEVKIVLPSKSRGKIVSYFYNVTLLQFRANQSRMTPDEIDSDTDTLYRLATVSEDPNLEANTSQKPVLLTPKKKRRR